MKTKFRHIQIFTLLSLLIISVINSNAQQLSSYSILLTGNTARGTLDEELFEKWNEASQDSEDLAYLMLGNIYDPEKRDVSKKLLPNSINKFKGTTIKLNKIPTPRMIKKTAKTCFIFFLK